MPNQTQTNNDPRIHKFRQGDLYILMDIHSGGIYEIDALTYRLLDFLSPPLSDLCPTDVLNQMQSEGFSVDEVNESYDELLSLYKEDLLYSEDTYRPYADATLNAPIKAMCLHIAHDCNLRCAYCFAETGEYHGKSGRKLMTVETAKKAIDFLVEKSFGRENLEVDFFGGEPLMAWDTVVKTVEYARSIEKQYHKNFRFTITTNGLLLDDEKIEFINREMSNCVLSLDGRKEVNDRMRYTQGKKGCYDVIVPKYKKLVASRNQKGRTDYYVRGTFTGYNTDFAEDVLHIHRLGFHNISVEPVVTDPSLPYAITEENLSEILKEYDRLYEIMKNDPDAFLFFHFMVDLQGGPCVIKRLRGCGCGNEYVAVTPEGDIYPCHQFTGMAEWKMGNLFNNTLDTSIKDLFARTHIYTKKGCTSCWARFYCSGGCCANSFQYEGDINIPNDISCALQKKRTECAIALKVSANKA